MTAEFAVNNKIHLVTKISLFIANYSKELRMGADIKRMKKMKKNNRICKENKKGLEKNKIVLRKVQEEIKQQVD